MRLFVLVLSPVYVQMIATLQDRLDQENWTYPSAWGLGSGFQRRTHGFGRSIRQDVRYARGVVEAELHLRRREKWKELGASEFFMS